MPRVPEVDDPALLRDLLDRARLDQDELNHRVANSIQRTAALIRAQRQGVDSEDARLALLSAEMRLEGIARMHRCLCDRTDGGDVALQVFLAQLGANLVSALGVDVKIACDPVTVPGETAAQVAVVVSELALNAIKHAYGDRDGGQVTVECRQDGGTLRMRVSDHGTGFPAGFRIDAPSNGVGMRIVADAAGKLGATVQALTDDGAVVVLEIPLH